MPWWWLIAGLLLTSGCATFSSEHFNAVGSQASVMCIKGGYAMAGGLVTGAKVNEVFKGTVRVTSGCDLEIHSED